MMTTEYEELDWSPELKQRIVQIYMEYNHSARGGNVIPLEVAIELAMVELGIISIDTAHERHSRKVQSVFRTALDSIHRRLLKGRSD